MEDYVSKSNFYTFKTIVFFTGWDFIREHKWLYWPALPWTVVAIGTIILVYSLN